MTSPASAPRLLRLARRWFGRATAARVFEPLIADWQHEWLAAGSRARRLLAWWSGAAATAIAIATLVVTTTRTSQTLRALLRQMAIPAALNALFLFNSSARHVPWTVAAVWTLTAVVSLLPMGVTAAMWKSRRYARMWDIGLGITAASAAVALALAGWLQPMLTAATQGRFATFRPELAMSLPALWAATPSAALAPDALRYEQLIRLGPAMFALLSGLVGAAQLRNGRWRDGLSTAHGLAVALLVFPYYLVLALDTRGEAGGRSVTAVWGAMSVMCLTACVYAAFVALNRRHLMRAGKRQSSGRTPGARLLRPRKTLASRGRGSILQL